MKRASPVLMSRGATAGIHAAWLTRSERSQKKKRLSSWAVSKRIQRARGSGLNKNGEEDCMPRIYFRRLHLEVTGSLGRMTVHRPYGPRRLLGNRAPRKNC